MSFIHTLLPNAEIISFTENTNPNNVFARKWSTELSLVIPRKPKPLPKLPHPLQPLRIQTLQFVHHDKIAGFACLNRQIIVSIEKPTWNFRKIIFYHFFTIYTHLDIKDLAIEPQ